MKSIVKVFISQPMKGLSQKEIKERRENAIKKVKRYFMPKYKAIIIDSFIEEEPPEVKNVSIWYLGKSIEFIADADYAFFLDGWGNNNGCVIENQVARKNDVSCIYEDDITPWFQQMKN